MLKSKIHCKHGDHQWGETRVYDWAYGIKEEICECEVCHEVVINHRDIEVPEDSGLTFTQGITTWALSIISLYAFGVFLVAEQWIASGIMGVVGFLLLFYYMNIARP